MTKLFKKRFINKLLVFLLCLFSLACSEMDNKSVTPFIETRMGILQMDSGIIMHDIEIPNDGLELGTLIHIDLEAIGINFSHYPDVEISKDGTTYHYMTLLNVEQNNTEAHMDVYALEPGTWYIRGVCYENETEYYTEPQIVEVIFPHESVLLEDSEIKQRFDELWNSTIEAESSGRRREYGCQIRMATKPDSPPSWVFEDFPPGPINNDCSSGAFNGITIHVTDITTDNSRGDSGASMCVAVYHTHPPLTRCPSTSYRATGPSTTDESTALSHKIISFVRDYNWPGSIHGGHSSYDANMIKNISSYDRRRMN